MNDIVNWTQYLLAMLVLLGLLGGLGLFAYAVQRGWILQNMTGLRTFAAASRRLSIVETLVVDPRRRVVIIRCDDREHVLLLGAERETVLTGQASISPLLPAAETESVR